MWYVGQVLRHVDSGDLVVYAGIDDDGMWVFAPEETRVDSADYAEVMGEDGSIDIGDFAERVGDVVFFGRIETSRMDDADWEVVQRICA